MSLKRNLFLLTTVFTIEFIKGSSNNITANSYHQVIPLITKKINPNEATDAQKNILNCSKAFLEHAKNNLPLNPEIIKAIDSVDFFSDILPQYLETNTACGSIQAALITAQMSDNIETLQYKQSIIKYFNENPKILTQLNDSFKSLLPEKQNY